VRYLVFIQLNSYKNSFTNTFLFLNLFYNKAYNFDNSIRPKNLFLEGLIDIFE
jgi:hypothetical protein